MKFSRFLSRRTAAERCVIACLRGSTPAGLDAGLVIRIARIFADFAQIVRQKGGVLFASGSPFISEDEVAVLSDLALAQRQSRMASDHADPAEYAALLDCAAVLSEAGLWLPINALPRGSAANANRTIVRSSVAIDAGPVRARAIALARRREVASTGDFAAAGVSRQYVSQLCKDGYLQRICFGWYRAAPVEQVRAAARRKPAAAHSYH